MTLRVTWNNVGAKRCMTCSFLSIDWLANDHRVLETAKASDPLPSVSSVATGNFPSLPLPAQAQAQGQVHKLRRLIVSANVSAMKAHR